MERGLLRVSHTDHARGDLALLLPDPDLMERFREIPKSDVATVTVESKGKVLVDGKSMPVPKAGSVIRKRLQANPHLVVAITSGEGAVYGDFVQVLDLAKQAGATRIVINPPSS